MKLIYELELKGKITYSYSGKFIVENREDSRKCNCYEAVTGKVLWSLNACLINQPIFSYDEKYIYFVGIENNNGKIFQIEVLTGLVEIYYNCSSNLSRNKIPIGLSLENKYKYILLESKQRFYNEIPRYSLIKYFEDTLVEAVVLEDIDYFRFEKMKSYQDCIYFTKSYINELIIFNQNQLLKNKIVELRETNKNISYFYTFHRDINLMLLYCLDYYLNDNQMIHGISINNLYIISNGKIIKTYCFTKNEFISYGFSNEDTYFIFIENTVYIYGIKDHQQKYEFKIPFSNHNCRIEFLNLTNGMMGINRIVRGDNIINIETKRFIYDIGDLLPSYPFKKYEPIKPLAFKLIEGMDTSSLPDYLEYGLKAIDIEVMKHRQLDDEHYIVIDKHDTYYLVIVELNQIKEVHLIKEVTLKDVYHEPITKRKAIKGIKQVISEGDIEDKALNRVYHMVLMKYEYAQPNSIQYKRETAYLNEIMRQIAIDLEALKDQTINYIGVQYSNEEGYYDSSIMLGFDDSSEMPAGMKYGREFIMGGYLEGKEKKLAEDYSRMIEKKKKYEDYRELMSTKLYTMLKAKYPDKSIEIFELSD